MNLRISIGPSCFATPGAEVSGQITHVIYAANRTCFAGRLAADHTEVGTRSGLAAVHKGIRYTPRISADGTFEFTIPRRVGGLKLSVGDGTAVTLAGISRMRMLRHQLATVPTFSRAVVRAIPLWKAWRASGDTKSREALKAVMGLVRHGEASFLPDALFSTEAKNTPDRQNPQAQKVSIILPIFNGLTYLRDCLAHLERHTDPRAQLILIEDYSTDPLVRPFLATWIASLSGERAQRVALIENEENLGFVRSVNIGLACAVSGDEPRDVIILNSDALVPSGWVDRLLDPIWNDRTIASVTPFSNDAELMTAPTICAPSHVSDAAAFAADKVASKLCREAAIGNVIVGVGFCMGLNKDALKQVPNFDEAFGCGYGEEVDWCLKTAQLGFRHVANGRLFVAHKGAGSFTSEAKETLLRSNGRLLTRRYPSFDADVQDFLARDPLIGPRLVIGLAILGETARGAISIFFAHSLGGGAEMDLERRISHELETVGGAVIIRVGGTTRWQIELHSPSGVTKGKTDSTALLLDLIAIMTRTKIVYSCGVGDPDPLGMVDVMTRVADLTDAHVDVLMHDYFPISPSYTLLGPKGTYGGVPTAASASARHLFECEDGSFVSLKDWQSGWGAFLGRAARIEVFSNSSADIVAQAYPDCAERIDVKPHRVLTQVPRCDLPAPRDPHETVIGVLGNLNRHKGGLVVAEIAKHMKRTGQGKIVVLGEIAPELAMPHVRCHGAYAIDDIPALVQRYRISRWLMPSIWPETFSFTTYEMLATGLPVFTFDLGAQAHAVAAAIAGGAQGAVIIPPQTASPNAEDIARIATELTMPHSRETCGSVAKGRGQ